MVKKAFEKMLLPRPGLSGALFSGGGAAAADEKAGTEDG